MSVFTELAETKNRLRRAEREQRALQVQFEQAIVNEAGVKALGPNIIDQQRAFEARRFQAPNLLNAEDLVADLEDAVELARAAVREYECEAGVTRAVFHD